MKNQGVVEHMRSPAFRFISSLLLVLALSQPVFARPAPDFTLPTAGADVNLQAYRGKVVYLDFWASWCIPCRNSFPWMNAMHQRHADQGLVVLAVNVDRDAQAVRHFLDKYPANFTVAYDPEGHIAELYHLKGMPTSYLIDRQGHIVMSHVGFRQGDAASLEQQIEQLLSQ